jgi:hypothetical protein
MELAIRSELIGRRELVIRARVRGRELFIRAGVEGLVIRAGVKGYSSSFSSSLAEAEELVVLLYRYKILFIYS